MRTALQSLIALLLMCSPAYAIFNINTADITKGKLILESRNRIDEDDRPSKDGLQGHALRFSYGTSDRMTMEGQALWQELPRHGFEYTSTNLEAKFRFYEPKDYWLDSAVKIGYEMHSDDGRADQLQARLILQKKIDKWTTITNINFAKEIGAYTRNDLQSNLGWQTKYTLDRHFEPGFEYYANFGELAHMPSYENQAHRIGPMFFGEIVPNMKYQIGYLFGISHAAEDGSAKFFLRYEIPL